jgi:hypothetical protein
MKCDNCGASLPAAKTPVVTCGYCGAEVATARPPEVAKGSSSLLADRDGDGIPDIVEGLIGEGQVASSVTVQSATRYEVDGKVYSSLEEMPPHLRQLLEQSQQLLAGHPQPIEGVVAQQQVISRVSETARSSSSDEASFVIGVQGRVRRVKPGGGWVALILIALAVVGGLLLALLAR